MASRSRGCRHLLASAAASSRSMDLHSELPPGMLRTVGDLRQTLARAQPWSVWTGRWEYAVPEDQRSSSGGRAPRRRRLCGLPTRLDEPAPIGVDTLLVARRPRGWSA